jgi:methylenetetrahydrofolate reductase (NADPH)
MMVVERLGLLTLYHYYARPFKGLYDEAQALPTCPALRRKKVLVMFDFPYLVEMLTPKLIDAPDARGGINLFAERYYRVLDAGLGISAPDNPMGQPRFSLLETIEQADLPVRPERTVMNLNTFHIKEALDALLQKTAKRGIRYLLVIRGDGGPKLSHLDPQSIGGAKNVTTSIDLIRYINREYAGQFITGCAYNQYNPMPFESDRLQAKIEAGARFVITQPAMGKDSNIDALFAFGLPIVIEAWMSRNVDLLFKSIRQQRDEWAKGYDPTDTIHVLHGAYPDSCIYLSMLGFKKQWRGLLPRL